MTTTNIAPARPRDTGQQYLDSILVVARRELDQPDGGQQGTGDQDAVAVRGGGGDSGIHDLDHFDHGEKNLSRANHNE